MPATGCVVVAGDGTGTSGLPSAMMLRLLRALPGVRDLIVTVAHGSRRVGPQSRRRYLRHAWHQPRGARTTRLRSPRVMSLVARHTPRPSLPASTSATTRTPFLSKREDGKDANLPIFVKTKILAQRVRTRGVSAAGQWRPAHRRSIRRSSSPDPLQSAGTLRPTGQSVQ
jgi:hypothetical protein